MRWLYWSMLSLLRVRLGPVYELAVVSPTDLIHWKAFTVGLTFDWTVLAAAFAAGTAESLV